MTVWGGHFLSAAFDFGGWFSISDILRIKVKKADKSVRFTLV